jgi:hypothetical protein
LVWRRLGVLIVSCYPLSELASKQLLEISRHVPGLIKAQGLDSQTIIVSGHIGSFTDHWKEFLTNLEHQLSQCIILSVIRQSSISVTTELTRICQGRIHVQELRHSCLGRLTSFRLILIWGGFGDYVSFKPGRRKMIRTNIMAGLAPIARLATRATSVTIKQGFIWKPHTEGKLFPWPRPHRQIWVETWSVFDKDQLSTRELTLKKQDNCKTCEMNGLKKLCK